MGGRIVSLEGLVGGVARRGYSVDGDGSGHRNRRPLGLVTMWVSLSRPRARERTAITVTDHSDPRHHIDIERGAAAESGNGHSITADGRRRRNIKCIDSVYQPMTPVSDGGGSPLRSLSRRLSPADVAMHLTMCGLLVERAAELARLYAEHGDWNEVEDR